MLRIFSDRFKVGLGCTAIILSESWLSSDYDSK